MAKKKMGQVVDSREYDSPIAGTYPPAHITTVKAEIGEGGAEIGTVLVKDVDGEGEYAPVTSALTEKSLIVVLAENISAALTDTVTVYDGGCFADTRLKANGYELTATDYAVMRQAGFAVNTMVE